ncbi:MAG: hypothetical protein AB7U20_09445, partial [Planctomycetaceae bacterium]
QLFEYVDSACFNYKCEHRAKMAWMDARDLYGSVAYPYNFGEGFRAGYKAVCTGKEGCSPPTPPRRYWSSCYLNCEGKAKALAWYDGFGHGVVAASCSGCADHCQIAVGAGSSGSGEMGSALKGYQPPIRNPNTNAYGPDGSVPDGQGPQPTPFDRPLIPPPGNPPEQDVIPEDEGELVPQAPAAQRPQGLPYLPAAEAYRVPVF